MSTRHTVRYHLLAAEADVGEVNQALRERLGERVVGFVPQDTPGLWACSGQWTPEEAAALVAACDGLPVKVVRGVTLGFDEPGVVKIGRGQSKPRGEQGLVRSTVEAAFEEWSKEQETGDGASDGTRKR